MASIHSQGSAIRAANSLPCNATATATAAGACGQQLDLHVWGGATGHHGVRSALPAVSLAGYAAGPAGGGLLLPRLPARVVLLVVQPGLCPSAKKRAATHHLLYIK